MVYDYSGNNRDGTYGFSTNGNPAAYDGFENDQWNQVEGPRPPGQDPYNQSYYPGFDKTNLSVGLRSGVTNSFVSIPPLDLNTDSVTITMWVNFQNPPLLASWTGLLMWRNGSNDAAGFGFGGITNADGSGNIVAELGYTWNTNNPNTYNWNSHLFLEEGIWSFVALTVTPTNATIYLYYARDSYTNMLKAVNTTNHSVESFSGAYSAQTWIGSDPQGGIGGGRSFPGSISDVAVYKRAMKESEIQRLFLMALGIRLVYVPTFKSNRQFRLLCMPDNNSSLVVWPAATRIRLINGSCRTIPADHGPIFPPVAGLPV